MHIYIYEDETEQSSMHIHTCRQVRCKHHDSHVADCRHGSTKEALNIFFSGRSTRAQGPLSQGPLRQSQHQSMIDSMEL